MRSLYALLLAYVAVLSVVGVASALFAKRLTPVQLNQWLPRLRLLNLLLVGAFIVVVAIYVRVWFLAIPAVGIVLFYPYVRYVRVCEGCGPGLLARRTRGRQYARSSRWIRPWAAA